MGSIIPMKEIDERINEIISHGREKQAIAPSHDTSQSLSLCHQIKSFPVSDSIVLEVVKKPHEKD